MPLKPERDTRRARVLLLAPRHPYPPWRGDQLRAFHLARSLAAHADVRVLCFGAADEVTTIDGVSMHAVPAAAWGRVVANLRAPNPVLPIQVRMFLDAGLERALTRELDDWQPDVVHATLSRMAPYLPPAGACHRHLDLVDSLYLNMLTRAGSSRGLARLAFRVEGGLIGRYEAKAAAQADTCSVVSTADQAAPGLERAAVIPNGVDTDAFSFEDPRDRSPTAIFFGNLGYYHNAEPARFLAEEVMPRVRDRRGDARLVVAGARPARSVQRLATQEGVEVVPDPPDLVPLLHRAAVAAVPMFSGSGMKNKVLESFAAGVPVVTNALGCEGVTGVVDGEHLARAETADETADAIVRLFDDEVERSRLAAAARVLVTERYGWQRRAEAMLALYGLTPTGSPPAR